jgi:nitroreductase
MTTRTADPRILPAIVDRWSPRSFDGQPVPAQDLATIFEAAGLAPSAFNFQPWRFLYAVKGDAHWDAFLDILIPFNQGWAASAGALVFIISTETSTAADGTTSPLYSHSFDAGAAWACWRFRPPRWATRPTA